VSAESIDNDRAPLFDETMSGPGAASHLVMVIDDDASIRETLCELLEEEGYPAVGAANGRDALAALRAGPLPCLILLDLMMPVMNGWEFREQQQRDPALAAIPVAVITAAGLQQGETIHAEAVLPKPLRIEAVLGVLRKYC
jgi:CheY-like chemotaxis protein